MSGYVLRHNPTTITTPVTAFGTAAVYGGPGTAWHVVNLSSIAGMLGYGVLLADGGSVTNGSTATPGASISTTGLAGIQVRKRAATVTNFGTISGGELNIGVGVDLEAGGSVINSKIGTKGGYISGADSGIIIAGGRGKVTNSGTINGFNQYAVELLDGGTILNGGAGSPSAAILGGIGISNAAGTVTNLGRISSVQGGVYLHDGGAVTNGEVGLVGATISSLNTAIEIGGTFGHVTNFGKISALPRYGSSPGGDGVDLDKGGVVTNAKGGSISGNSGVAIRVGDLFNTVTNFGTIIGATASGVSLADGVVVNGSAGAAAASINGSETGIGFSFDGEVTNFGRITGERGNGIELDRGGNIANGRAGAAAAAISGGASGVEIALASGSVVNFGKIVGLGGYGVELQQGGIVVNRAGATISGYAAGVRIGDGDGMVTNFGTISGIFGTAIEFGVGNDRLVVGPDSAFLGSGRKPGIVDGGAGSNTIELAGTAPGILAGLGSEFIHFDKVIVARNATWQIDAAAAALPGTTIVGAGGADALALTSAGGIDLAGVRGFQRIELASTGSNTLIVRNSNFGGISGNRITIDGGNKGDTMTAALGAGHGVALEGGAARDTFNLSPTTLAVSTVSGGGGGDTLSMSAAGTIRLTGVSGIEKLRLSGGSKNRLTLTNSNFLHVADNVITVFAGGDGNTVDASALSSGNRVVFAGGAGADVLKGGAGNDSFSVSRAVLAHAGTRITGGGGKDTLVLTDSGAVTTIGVSGIGTIRLASTGNNSLTLRDANFTGMGASVISVQGGDSGNNITEATVSAGLRAILVGGAGADTIVAGREATMTGGSGADLFVLTTPGSAKTPDKNTITDFAAASDRLAFSSAGFGLGIAGAGAAPKQLPAGLFSPEPNGTFTSSTERFAYDRSNGALYFDADGIVPANSPMRIATIANHAALGTANLFFVA